MSKGADATELQGSGMEVIFAGEWGMVFYLSCSLGAEERVGGGARVAKWEREVQGAGADRHGHRSHPNPHSRWSLLQALVKGTRLSGLIDGL
jgi:hypothetical protein